MAKNTKAISRLKEITTAAKRIRKQVGGKWITALKKAGAEYRKKKGKK